MAVVKNPNKNEGKGKKLNAGGKREFYIEYNPYKNETTFLMNGEIAGGGFETYKRDFRLQQYLEKREGWDGLFEEIVKKCNSKNIKVTFKGRSIDFDDLKLRLDSTPYKDSISLEFTPAKKDTDMIKDIGELIDGLHDTEIDELKDCSRFEAAYSEAQNSQLKVSVIATMSSGKSTLINSLLGQELLPSQNEACTATVARILDNDDKESFDCVCKNKDEIEICRKEDVKRGDLEEYNNQGKEKDNDDPDKIIFMDLEGPIPGVNSGKIRLLLQDTPGPNNSRDRKHKELTEEMIKDRKNSVILYVMNATQLRVEDDYKLLNTVSTAMRNGGKQTRDRFMFIINKFDELDLEKEDSQKTIQATRDYLKEFGIEHPNVFPISAYAALLIRKNKNDMELSRKESKDLQNYVADFGDPSYEKAHFEKLADISPYVKKILEERLETADELERALIHTGVPAIEETINEYLEKYAYPIKVNDAVNELKCQVKELDMVRKFNDSILSSEEQRKKLLGQIETAKNNMKVAGKTKDSFKEKIDEFNLDTSQQKEIRREVTEEIEDITGKFEGKSDVKEAQARGLLKNFERQVVKLQDKFESQLQYIIENEIKDKGEQMSSEYNAIVLKMFEDVKLDGFDFSSVKDIDRYKISNMSILINKNKRQEDIEETYTIRNSEREGFWGFFKFWKPKYITKTRVIGTETYIDVQNIVFKQISDIEAAMYDNIDKAFERGKEEVAEYKETFKRNMDRLDEKIKDIIEEQKEKVENVGKLAKSIENNRKKLSEIEKLSNRIDSIMNF